MHSFCGNCKEHNKSMHTVSGEYRHNEAQSAPKLEEFAWKLRMHYRKGNGNYIKRTSLRA